MPRGKKHDRDGIFQRKDRPGAFYGSWTDASGRRRKRKLDAHTLQQARTLLNAERARVERARTLGYVPPTKETLGAIISRYLQHQKARISRKGYERARGIVETHLKRAFGPMRLSDIRRVDIQKYITERAGEVSPGSVTKELNVLKHLLGLAVEWELIPLNAAHGVKAPRVPAGRVRYLQPTELRAVLADCPEWLRPIAGLAAFTAMRRGEILGLRWLDVDLKGGRILLPQTKNGDGRVVYLNGLAHQVLTSLRAGAPTDCVFPTSDSVTPENVSLAFLRACRRVGIPDFCFHDLRHTAASWLRMQGADIHTVAQLLGHKDLRMAARYQHLSPAFLSDAVKRLDDIFGESPKLPTKKPARLPARTGEMAPQKTRKRGKGPALSSPQRPQSFSEKD
jgi:integrase